MISAFTVHVPDEVLDDLCARIRSTRWPPAAPVEPWEQGTDLDYLRGLLTYWASGFDWRAQEAELNELDHYRVHLDGVPIHFVHQKARNGNGIPLILTHGWPSLFLEYLPLVPLLTDRFDLVIPSLPGYGFSGRPDRTGVNYRYVAELWHRLMRLLGYTRYGAAGGDFGSGVSTLMALDDPTSMLGIYVSTLELDGYRGPESRPLSTAEQSYLESRASWDARERGYSHIQSTKPQTVGYALNDSPAGLAAWILEKWHSWAAADVDPDHLLTMLTIYWATQSVTTSLRDYYDNRWTGVTFGPTDFVAVPTGVGAFNHHRIPEGDPPREWFERLYNVTHWTPMPRGGHFAATEEPELLAADLAAFFGQLPRA
ncbi:MAG: epoxide hydrolase family protein [Stackebrandtia sp.]